MKVENNELLLTKDELINMIKNDNPDKNDWSNKTLVEMLTRFKYLSKKQHEWVLSKIKYIVNHNVKYKNFKRKFKYFDIIGDRE